MLTLSRHTEVRNALGLHLRAAEQFARTARQFRSEIAVFCGDKQVDGKSILDLATLAAGCGTRLRLEASGPDAEAAIDALEVLIDAGFYEAAVGVNPAPPLSTATRPDEGSPTGDAGDDRSRTLILEVTDAFLRPTPIRPSSRNRPSGGWGGPHHPTGPPSGTSLRRAAFVLKSALSIR